MMKLVISLAFLAMCSAYTFVDDYKTYHVQVDLDHIVVSNQIGHQVHIYINKHQGLTVGPGVIQVHYCDLQGCKMIHQIHDIEEGYRGQCQSDILHHIFRQYQGHLDEETFVELVHVVAKHVQTNDVDPMILHCLKALASHNWEMSMQNWGVNVHPTRQNWINLLDDQTQDYKQEWYSHPTQSYFHQQGPYNTGLSHWNKLFGGVRHGYGIGSSVDDLAGHHQVSHWDNDLYGKNVWQREHSRLGQHWGQSSRHEVPVVV